MIKNMDDYLNKHFTMYKKEGWEPYILQILIDRGVKNLLVNRKEVIIKNNLIIAKIVSK